MWDALEDEIEALFDGLTPQSYQDIEQYGFYRTSRGQKLGWNRRPSRVRRSRVFTPKRRPDVVRLTTVERRRAARERERARIRAIRATNPVWQPAPPKTRPRERRFPLYPKL